MKKIKQDNSKDLPWEEAIQKVLRNENGSLHYSLIAERISESGLRKKVGANPAQVVSTVLSRSVSEDSSPFVRTARGEYALKESLKDKNLSPILDAVEAEKSETGALRAFGMFWRREYVLWAGKGRILGRQSTGAADVDFSRQIGVYLLHDRDRVVYVGRADDTMFARLKAHTADRLSGRWDRFSWFGLLSVQEDGSLSERSMSWSHAVVIETLEALLIESLEPPLNRKRGDNFSAAEYIQSVDPEIEAIRKKQIIADLAKAAGV